MKTKTTHRKCPACLHESRTTGTNSKTWAIKTRRPIQHTCGKNKHKILNEYIDVRLKMFVDNPAQFDLEQCLNSEFEILDPQSSTHFNTPWNIPSNDRREKLFEKFKTYRFEKPNNFTFLGLVDGLACYRYLFR